ncbi:DNA polymerase III subunit delta [Tepidanaerobacter sp. GT38]|uniref:DNA polymerase III subunit delta n=1 Tax=Tepidanaerobacter sp. GT38 TaxID=2722793 RepID=UPI001F02951B|nr:DNA polymerase III subunit delta [Tepidanaerobacter sp. GT38]MCG1012804.1 DNA polymerase III subunit delta [Tepidanaerobacter sp. GT38]
MKNVILLFGEEKLLINDEISKIKQKLVPDYLEAVNFIPLDGKNVHNEEIINACQTVPLITDKKLVVVYDAGFFEGGKGDQEKPGERQDDFLNMLEMIPDYTVLILTALKVDKRKKAYKILESKGIVREFNQLSIKDKAFWVQKRAKLYGKSMDLKTAYLIAEYTGNLYQTDNELKKIAAFLGDKGHIEPDDLSKIFFKSLEGNIFEMMDFIGMKNPSRAIEIINRLINQGEKAIVILYMISKHMMDLLTVKTMEGLSFQDIKSKSGLHPFVLKKALQQSKNFTLNELKSAIRLCQQLDTDIKTGKIQDVLGLELLVTRISL